MGAHSRILRSHRIIQNAAPKPSAPRSNTSPPGRSHRSHHRAAARGRHCRPAAVPCGLGRLSPSLGGSDTVSPPQFRACASMSRASWRPRPRSASARWTGRSPTPARWCRTPTPVDKRLVSTLPPLHIALVAPQACCPILPRCSRAIDPRTVGYLSFITGPSRTADIERVLTIGVHGPERLIIVCVDELGGRRTDATRNFKRIHSVDALAQPQPHRSARPVLRGLSHQPRQGLRRHRLRSRAHADRRASSPYAAAHFDELAETVYAQHAEARGAKVFRTSDPASGQAIHPEAGAGKRREEHRQVQVHGLGGDPPQRASGKGRHRGAARPIWASGSCSWPARRPRTW